MTKIWKKNSLLLIAVLLIVSISVFSWAQNTIVIHIIGDSTVCNYAESKYPQTGWGQVLGKFFINGSVTINNKAIGGRSSRSFFQEGRWDEVTKSLKSGDYVFIQFGHNDRDYNKEERYTDTTAYKEYLRNYVKQSREKGAIPVLITPMNMNAWNGTSVREVFCEGANNYRGAMVNVSKELSVPLIDLEKKSVDLQKRVGQTYSAQYIYLGLDAGEYANFPDGSSDGTHFQEMGANFMAKFVCEGITALKDSKDMSKLASLLKPLYKVVVSFNKTNTGMITESGNTFPMGASIAVKVKPKSGETFQGWFDQNGKLASSAKIYTFNMPGSDINITARFAGGTEPFILKTSVADGEGNVTPDSSLCNPGETVNIIATASEGYLFDHWSGDLNSSDNPAEIKMNSNKTIFAHFVSDTNTYYEIAVKSSAGGSIEQQPDKPRIAENNRLSFTAKPIDGWKFVKWTGDYSGSDSLFIIDNVKSDISISAVFIPIDPCFYEMEFAEINNGIIEATNEGFSGTGYVNFDNLTGSSVEFPVYIFSEGELNATITFANGSTTSRTISIFVNDLQVINSLDFASTGNWTTWDKKSLKLALNQGINLIKFVSISSDGGPNIDNVKFDQSVSISKAVKQNNPPFRFDPNRGIVHLNNLSAPARVELFSMDGKLVFKKTVAPKAAFQQIKLPVNIRSGHFVLTVYINEEKLTDKVTISKR